MHSLKREKQISKDYKLILIENIYIVLLQTPHLLQEMFEKIQDDLISKRRIPNAWTIEEWGWHLMDAQTLFKNRFLSIAESKNELIKTHQPDFSKAYPIPADQELGNALVDFERIRNEQIEWLKNQPLEFWDKAVRHEEYYPFNPGILLRHMMLVDQVHLFQIEKLWLTKEEYL
jgi:hypothetical protein